MPRTVYVLGAGASFEADLPIGDGLAQHISSMLSIRTSHHGGSLSGDRTCIDAMSVYAREQKIGFNSLVEAACHISDALPMSASIDNFLDSHRTNALIEVCGKIAIVVSILHWERQSKLKVDYSNMYNTMDFDGLRGTWFKLFFELLSENCTIEQLQERLGSISFVVFNYDRCIEHFLYHAIQLVYNVKPKRAAELLNALEVVHPYGMVAPLPWMNEASGLPFGGATNNDHQLVQLARGIATFSQMSSDVSEAISRCRFLMASADKLVFLGFAFHPINMELLFSDLPTVEDRLPRRCFATFFKRSKSDRDIVSRELYNKLQALGDVEIRTDLTCKELFSEYSRSLSLVRP